MSAEPLDDFPGAPAFWSTPPRDGSLRRAVEGVAAKVGRTLDPSQQFAVDVLTSAWKDGRPASREVAVIAPRQNLKTYCLELIALTRALRPGGDRLIVWSAHEVSTAQETFKTLHDLSELVPWLGDQMLAPSRATGREELRFKNGCRIKFKARIKTGGRGLAGDMVVLDEAFALQPEHMGSLMPILSTKAKGQIIYGSSAPHAASDVLRKVVQRGRLGGMAYVEWCAPGSLNEPGCADPRCSHEPGIAIGEEYTPAVEGCVFDDESMWLAANSAATHGRISLGYLRAERAALTPEEFARERLGWGEAKGASNAPFTVARWDALATPGAESTGQPVFAVDMTPSRTAGAIAVASRMDDGTPLLEVVAHGLTPAELQDAVAERAQRWPGASWVAASGSAVESIAPGLRDLGVIVRTLPPRDVAAACGLLQDHVAEGRLAHLGDPILSRAIEGAARKDVGDGAWIWTRRKSDVDISALYAVTLAHWDVATSPGPSQVF